MPRTKFYTFDDSIIVGDKVFCGYNNTVCEVIAIDRRFLTLHEINRYSRYKGCRVGDEINPLVRIKVIYNKRCIRQNSKAIKAFDGSHIWPLSPNVFSLLKQPLQEKLDNMNKMQKELGI